MHKYRVKSTGKPVKINDVITIIKEKKTSFGDFKSTTTVLVTEHNINALIKTGIIEEVKPQPKLNMELGHYVERLAKQFEVSIDEMADILDKINKVFPRATLDLLLKSIYDEFVEIGLEKKTINYPRVVYYIDKITGDINSISTCHGVGHIVFTSYDNIALARLIVAKQIQLIYGE